MAQSKQCPKCGGSMAEGFILDQTHGSVGVSRWVEGTAEKSVWTGLKLTGRPQTPIATWRCGRCGFLESYASGDPAGGEAVKKRALAILLVAAAVAMMLGLAVAFMAQRGP